MYIYIYMCIYIYVYIYICIYIYIYILTYTRSTEELRFCEIRVINDNDKYVNNQIYSL